MEFRNQFIDGAKLTVEDLTDEQNYFISKIDNSIKTLCDNGVEDIESVNILPDCIWYESTSFDDVKVKIDANFNLELPNEQNSTLLNVDRDLQLYTVFKAPSNLQRIDLRITRDDNVTNNDFWCVIKLKELIDPKNPLSRLSTSKELYQIQFKKEDLPLTNSEDVLTLDFKHLNNLQGLTLKKDNYYSIHIQFVNMSNTRERIRVFHNKLSANIDSRLYTHYLYSNGYNQEYKQQVVDAESQLLVKHQIYHKIYTSAIKVTGGNIVINGKKITINDGEHRFIPLADRRCFDSEGKIVYNYVVAKYKETYINPTIVNDNILYKRIKDDVEILVLTESQYKAYKNNDILLLGVVTDANTMNFKYKVTTESNNYTRLFYKNWLNLDDNNINNKVESIYNNINDSYLFYVSNVPTEIPLVVNGIVQRAQSNVYDEYGNLIVKAGDPITEKVKKAYLILKNNKTKLLEMSPLYDVNNKKFLDYALIISNRNLNVSDIVVVVTEDLKELEQDVIYNYMVVTESGNPVFIQDYNKVINYERIGNNFTSIRLDDYKIKINKKQKAVVIDKDLDLATEPIVSTSLIRNIPIRIKGEIPTPMDATTTETVVKNYLKELKRSESFIFDGPMVLNDLTTKILTIDNVVVNAYKNNNFKILVDLNDGNGPIDITHSGDAPDSDKGGNGVAVIINGYLSDTIDIEDSLEVKVRGSNRRDNTNYSYNYYPYGPAIVNNSNRTFTVIARGKGIGSNAGFSEGEVGYIYIGDRKALDANKQPIMFTFNSQTNIINIGEIKYLGEKEYLREKQILSTENTNLAAKNTVLINTSINKNGFFTGYGQIIFHSDEIPDIYGGKVYIMYNKVNIEKKNPTYFKLRYENIGLYDGTPIDNSNFAIQGISVQDAFELSKGYNLDTLDDNFKSIAIFYDGINIMSDNSPIGKMRIVADDGSQLLPGEVAFNPDKGIIKFYNNNQLNIDFTKLVVSYYKLDKKFIYSNNPYNNYNAIYDINADGRIDVDDLYLFNNSYKSKLGDYNYNLLCDFNRDGYVGDDDYEQLINHFGSSVSTQDYYEATSYRVSSILLYKSNDVNKQYKISKVYCKKPDNIDINGRTILFLDDEIDVGEYYLSFGYRINPFLGYNTLDIYLQENISIPIYNTIKVFDKFNKEYSIIDIEKLGRENGRYKHRLYVNPLISAENEVTVLSRYDSKNIITINKKQIITTRKYELYRKYYGLYKIDLVDYDKYGKYIKIKIANDELCNDFLDSLIFTIHLYVKDDNGKYDVWTWYDVVVDSDGYITLSDNDNLFIEHKTKGRNRKKVIVSPFGLGDNQVALLPKMYGGHIENDLSNIHIMRSDINSRYVKKHKHTADDGGIISADNIKVNLNQQFNTSNNLQDVINKLLDIINLQTQQLNAIRLNSEFVWDGDLDNLVWDGDFSWDE